MKFAFVQGQKRTLKLLGEHWQLGRAHNTIVSRPPALCMVASIRNTRNSTSVISGIIQGRGKTELNGSCLSEIGEQARPRGPGDHGAFRTSSADCTTVPWPTRKGQRRNYAIHSILRCTNMHIAICTEYSYRKKHALLHGCTRRQCAVGRSAISEIAVYTPMHNPQMHVYDGAKRKPAGGYE